MSLVAQQFFQIGAEDTDEVGAGASLDTGTHISFHSAYSRQPTGGEGGSEAGFEMTQNGQSVDFAPWECGAQPRALIMFELKVDAASFITSGKFEILDAAGTTIARIDPVSSSATTAVEVWSGDVLTSRGTTDVTVSAGGYIQFGFGFEPGVAGTLFLVASGAKKVFLDSEDTGTTKLPAACAYTGWQNGSGNKDSMIPGIFVFDSLSDQNGGMTHPYPGSVMVPTSHGTDTNWVNESGQNSSAANLWPSVNDAPSVVDKTAYLETSTVGSDLLMGTATSQVWSSGTPDNIIAVVVSAIVERSGAGITKVKLACRLSGTTIYGPEITLGDAVSTRVTHPFPTKPGGGAWTLTDAGNATYGVSPVA